MCSSDLKTRPTNKSPGRVVSQDNSIQHGGKDSMEVNRKEISLNSNKGSKGYKQEGLEGEVAEI